MNTKVTIHDDEPPFIVHNAAQLDDALRLASDEARQRGILCAIRLEAQNGNEISIVLGSEETVLSFDYGHGSPPYYASKGSTDTDTPIMTCYLSFLHHTEFPRKYVIPLAEGIKAVRQFLDSGGLPTCIEWEEV